MVTKQWIVFFVKSEDLTQHVFIAGLMVSTKNDSDSGGSWIEELSLIRQELRFEDYNSKKRKRRNFPFLHPPNLLSITQCSDIAEDKFTFLVYCIVIILSLSIPLLLSPSCSSFSAAASLQSGGSDRESKVAWSKGKVRILSSASGQQRPMQRFCPGWCVCVCVRLWAHFLNVCLSFSFSPSSCRSSPFSRLFYSSIWTSVCRHCVPRHDTPESFHLAEQLASCCCGVPQGVAGRDNSYFVVHAQTGQWLIGLQQNMLRKQQEQTGKFQSECHKAWLHFYPPLQSEEG